MALTLSCATTSRAVETYHTPPDPNSSGGITGVVSPAEGLQHVVAFEATSIKAYGGELGADGRFTFHGLPPGEYDLLIKTVGHVYEGISLEADPDSQPPEPTQMSIIAAGVGDTWFKEEDYFNVKKIIRITATGGTSGDHARMFTILVRNLPVLDPGGTPILGNIRRFDFTEMVKTNKVWQVQTERHLLRQEVPYKTPDIDVEAHYSPSLSKILVGDDVKNVGTIDLTKLAKPEREYVTRSYDAAKGVLAEPKATTKDVRKTPVKKDAKTQAKKDAPTTAPAPSTGE